MSYVQGVVQQVQVTRKEGERREGEREGLPPPVVCSLLTTQCPLLAVDCRLGVDNERAVDCEALVKPPKSRNRRSQPFIWRAQGGTSCNCRLSSHVRRRLKLRLTLKEGLLCQTDGGQSLPPHYTYTTLQVPDHTHGQKITVMSKPGVNEQKRRRRRNYENNGEFIYSKPYCFQRETS